MSNFELEKRLTNPEFVNQRFAEIIKATFNLDLVTEKVFKEKRHNGFDEHINRLDPANQQLITPQPSAADTRANEQRTMDRISKEEAEALRLVESAHAAADSPVDIAHADKLLESTLNEAADQDPSLQARFDQLDQLYGSQQQYSDHLDLQDA